MSQPLYRVRADGAEKGIKPVPHKLDVDLWRDAANAVFFEGGPQKIQGWVSPVAFTPSFPVRGMLAIQDDAGVQRLFFGDKNSIFHYNSVSVATIGTGFNGAQHETSTTPASAWSMAQWGNWLVASDGSNNIQVWKGTGTVAALLGSPPTRAQTVIKKNNHLMLINNSLGFNNYAWCKADDLENWEFDNPESSAGNNIMREMNGPAVAACEFGGKIAVLGKTQLFFISYLGAPLYFGDKLQLSGIGACGKMAVCEANGMLYGVDDKGIWMTDGTSFRRVDSPAIREYIQGAVEQGQLSKVVVCHNSAVQEVQFFFPGATGEVSFGVGYRYANNSWTKLAYGRSGAVQQPGVFKYHVTCHPTLGLAFQGKLSGVDAWNDPLEAWVQTKPLDLDRPDYWKYVDMVFVQLRRQSGSFKVQIAVQEALDDPLVWVDSDPAEMDEAFMPAYFRETGRFVSFKFGSTAEGADWALSGFDVFGEPAGRVI